MVQHTPENLQAIVSDCVRHPDLITSMRAELLERAAQAQRRRSNLLALATLINEGRSMTPFRQARHPEVGGRVTRVQISGDQETGLSLDASAFVDNRDRLSFDLHALHAWLRFDGHEENLLLAHANEMDLFFDIRFRGTDACVTSYEITALALRLRADAAVTAADVVLKALPDPTSSDVDTLLRERGYFSDLWLVSHGAHRSEEKLLIWKKASPSRLPLGAGRASKVIVNGETFYVAPYCTPTHEVICGGSRGTPLPKRAQRVPGDPGTRGLLDQSWCRDG